MTDPNYTAMLLIIDRSGSMLTIRDDMVGGLQTLLSDQASEAGMLTVDVVTFDTEVDWTHHFADPAEARIELEPRGEENSSHKWSAEAVRDSVTEQTEKYGWDFVIRGANQKAALAARVIGIDPGSALDYSAKVDGVTAANSHLSRYVTDVRAGSRSAFTDEERRTAKGEREK